VILARQTPVSLFNFVRLGVALDAEYFVIVLLSHLSYCQLPISECRFEEKAELNVISALNGQLAIGNRK
jgi:hypothetical protein